MESESTVVLKVPSRTSSYSNNCLASATVGTFSDVRRLCRVSTCIKWDRFETSYRCRLFGSGCNRLLSDVVGGEIKSSIVQFSHLNESKSPLEARNIWTKVGNELFGIKPHTEGNVLEVPFTMTKPPWWTYLSCCWFRYIIDRPDYVNNFSKVYKDTKNIWVALASSECSSNSCYRTDKRILPVSNLSSEKLLDKTRTPPSTDILRILALKKLLEGAKTITHNAWWKQYSSGYFNLYGTIAKKHKEIFGDSRNVVFVREENLYSPVIKRLLTGTHTPAFWLKMAEDEGIIRPTRTDYSYA